MMHLNSKKWNNMLFEGRNMAYGAFKLRSASSRRHFFSFLIVLLAFAGLFAGYQFYLNWELDKVLKPVESMPPITSVPMNQSLDLQQYVEEHPVSPNHISSETAGTSKPSESTETPEDPIFNNKLQLDDIIKRTQQETIEMPKDAKEMFEEMEADKTYLVVDVMPEFPGGISAMFKFITSNMNYPLDAQRRKVQGRVVCEFIVNKDGNISDIRVVKSIDAVLDKEAIRILKQMPRWKYGERLGKPVRVKFSVPFNFAM
jgi:protein TonB